MVATKLPLVYSGKSNFHPEYIMRSSVRLPVIAAAFATIVAVAFKAKPACSICKSKFTWNEDCLVSGEPVCEKCGEDVPEIFHEGHPVMSAGRCSRKNLEEYQQRVNAKRALIDKAIKVRCYSKNYRGNVPPPKLEAKISTEWFPDKDEAEFELKKIAARKGCDVILNQDFECQSDASPQNPNYKISWFQFSGTI